MRPFAAMSHHDGDLLLLMGAGDIGGMAQQIISDGFIEAGTA